VGLRASEGEGDGNAEGVWGGGSEAVIATAVDVADGVIGTALAGAGLPFAVPHALQARAISKIRDKIQAGLKRSPSQNRTPVYQRSQRMEMEAPRNLQAPWRAKSLPLVNNIFLPVNRIG
jgi:hypothetical protein